MSKKASENSVSRRLMSRKQLRMASKSGEGYIRAPETTDQRRERLRRIRGGASS